jgi:peptide deformylase
MSRAQVWGSLFTALVVAGLAALLAGCGSDAASGGDGGTDGAPVQSDAGPQLDATPNDFVESYGPITPPAVRANRPVAVVFNPSSQAGDHVVPASVTATIDGAGARLFPYLKDAAANREFHHVPFPFWTPGSQVTVTVLAGAAYAGSGESMQDDLTWTFQVEAAPIHESYDAASTTALSADELAAAAAGGTTFLSANILKDWQDASSTLHLFSEPVDFEDPDVLALAAKLRDSLDGVSGIGLAAPQIGINRRLFGAELPGRSPEAYLNPVIVDWSQDQVYYWQNGLALEGCLSIPGVPAKVARPRWIVVDYHTADGTLVTNDRLEADTAVVFLHEYDHLNGILITDRQEVK